jgi:hypothetical protein
VAGGSVYESVGGLDVLVDETVLVYPAERSRQSNGETQELSQLHRRSNQSVEWLASGILEHEHGTAVVLCERDRANCPGGIQFASQRIFVLQAPKATGSWVLSDGGEQKPRGQGTVERVAAQVTVKDELTIFAECLAPAIRKLQHGGLPHRFHAASLKQPSRG